MNDAKRPTIFGLGAAAVDFRIRTADFGLEYTEKLLAREIAMLPGGAISNCLAGISRRGTKTCWLGKLGDDYLGGIITGHLEQAGIGLDGVIIESGVCSPFNLAAYAGPDCRRVGGWLLPNALTSITDADIEEWSGLVAKDDWLIVEIGEIPVDIVLKVCKRFAVIGVKIAIDVDLDPVTQCGGEIEAIREVFSLADVLIPNRNAMTAVYGDITAEELAGVMYRDYRSTTVVTAGAQGAWGAGLDGIIHQPALPVEVVDTVGAGDAFHGGLVWALSSGQSLVDALALAAQCGAEACQKSGAR